MRILIAILIFFGANILSAQEYSIYGKIEGLEDGEVLLGYYYGDKQFVKDTVESNHGFFHFESDEDLNKGMYFINILSNNMVFSKTMIGKYCVFSGVFCLKATCAPIFMVCCTCLSRVINKSFLASGPISAAGSFGDMISMASRLLVRVFLKAS